MDEKTITHQINNIFIPIEIILRKNPGCRLKEFGYKVSRSTAKTGSTPGIMYPEVAEAFDCNDEEKKKVPSAFGYGIGSLLELR